MFKAKPIHHIAQPIQEKHKNNSLTSMNSIDQQILITITKQLRAKIG
jgi:hypothetical protein